MFALVTPFWSLFDQKASTWIIQGREMVIPHHAAWWPSWLIKDAAQMQAAQEEARYETMSEKQIAREIKALEKKMHEHARNLEFEEAARARDRLAELKRKVFGVELAPE